MTEMDTVSRFFVNRFKGRANQRRYEWLKANLVLRPRATCLEIGCGNGDIAARIVDGLAPERYVATDLDLRQIEVARRYLARRYPHGPPEALELREADMLHLPFPDASFDAVFAFAVIHHASPSHRDFTNVPRALAEIGRVLRPTGILAYEEFVHKDGIREWLQKRDYVLAAVGHRGTREMVVAAKSAEGPSSPHPIP
jgi:ubiquinone/menaquinone biosynthesis C-methylase UbiE